MILLMLSLGLSEASALSDTHFILLLDYSNSLLISLPAFILVSLNPVLP